MEKHSNLKHIVIRIMILVLILIISIYMGLSTLNPSRKCGTGDFLACIPWFLCFYSLWSVGLIYEVFSFDKIKQKVKRNSNLIMTFFLPSFVLLLWLYFKITN